MNQTSIIVGIIISLILIFLFIQNKRWQNKLRQVDSTRPKLTRAEYIDILVKKGFDPKHIEVVHDELEEYISMDNFSMYPEDDIHKLYHIEDEDDMDLIDRICTKLNIPNVEEQDVEALNKDFNHTTAEYILTLTKNLTK